MNEVMNEVHWYGRDVFTAATKVNVETMYKAVQYLAKEVKQTLSKRGTGRMYKVLRSGQAGGIRGKHGKGKRFYRWHQASAPGEPPAPLMGFLKNSLQTGFIVDKSGTGILGKVGPDVDYLAAHCPAGTDLNYGFFLEVGTNRMRKRPYLLPTLRRRQKIIAEMFRRANGK